MTTYNTFEQNHLPLGVIYSSKSNLRIIKYAGVNEKHFGSNLLISPSLENVIVYNAATLQSKLVLKGEKSLVTRIQAKSQKIAVGYQNGGIKIWDIDSEYPPLAFEGHSSSITCLDFDENCTKLVSGSADTFLILWDILGECGLYRLKGHTDSVTSCRFMTSYNVLASCSKDKTLKFWDLSTQHCFSTLRDSDFQFSDFAFTNSEKRLVSAGSGEDLKVWEIVPFSIESKSKRSESNLDIVFTCNLLGSISKRASSGSKCLLFDQSSKLLICLNDDSTIEIFKISKKKKQKSKSGTEQNFEFTESSFLDRIGEISEKKLAYIDIFTDEKNRKILCLSHKNNSITLLHIETQNSQNIKSSKISSLTTQGHRSAPTCVAFNSNSMFFASGSPTEIKIWSAKYRTCAKTLPSEHCMCLLYAPGDRYLISGMKSGSIYIYDAITAEIVECLQAHNDAITNLRMIPNLHGIVSSSADSTVKFWLFENEKKFSLKLVRQLDMDEPVSCVCYSQCQKFIAVSALNDVKIFFDDSLKYYLTLYGHKLTVNSIDISHDNEVLITASSDKNIKIWGLNFGECRKSIYAHSSQINKVNFIPKTHLFFSCSKDGSLKLWDADSFKLVVDLKSHHKEIIDFCLNSDGDILISASRDFSLRIWEQSDELIVPETVNEEDDNENVVNIPLVKEAEKEVLAHWKPTYGVLKYTENLVDALDIHIKSVENPDEHSHPILSNLCMNSSEYVLYVLSQIPTNDLDVSLTTLPFRYVLILLSLIKDWMIFPNKLELCVRCASFLVKLHFYQLVNSPDLLNQFQELYIDSNEKISNLKSVVGVNMACLKFLKRKIEKDTSKFIYEEYLSLRKK